jgi:hypothetical protein
MAIDHTPDRGGTTPVNGHLDEDLEEPTLECEAGLMDVGLDPVGEMLVLVRHGQGDLQ